MYHVLKVLTTTTRRVLWLWRTWRCVYLIIHQIFKFVITTSPFKTSRWKQHHLTWMASISNAEKKANRFPTSKIYTPLTQQITIKLINTRLTSRKTPEQSYELAFSWATLGPHDFRVPTATYLRKQCEIHTWRSYFKLHAVIMRWRGASSTSSFEEINSRTNRQLSNMIIWSIQYDWQVDYCSPYLDSYY